MRFVLFVAGAFVAASLVVTLLVRLGLAAARRRPQGFARRALKAHLVLVPLYVFVGTPAFMGWFASRLVGTRGDERGYAGPRIAADGSWRLQSRASLRDEARGAATPDPDEVARARAATLRLTADDGVGLRAFVVQPREAPPRCTAILVHGLFRGGLELETPAAMFRDLGAETVLLELRNHGGGDRAAATFGRDERRDVLAAAAWVRSDPARAARPLVLFAVSLGTAAVLRAAPDVPGLSGLVLDAPMDELRATAHRMLAEGPRAGRPGPALPQPFRSLVLTSLELWSGFRLDEVRPIDAAARLPADAPLLVIGGGADERMPPATVTAVFDRAATRSDLKSLWIRPGSDHGQVWIDDPDAYRGRLAAFLERVAPRGAPASR